MINHFNVNALLRQLYMGLLVFFIFAPAYVSGQNEFSVSKISPALLVGADAVLRVHEMSFEIKSKAEAVQTFRQVVTILNESGEEKYSEEVVGYDKFTKILDINGAIYDADGKLLKKLKNADIKDYGNNSAAEITDNRFRTADFGKKSYPYPYTIEFSYQTREKNMMFYPKWMPTGSPRIAVEKSTYKIKAPAEFKFRFKEYNGVTTVVKSKDADGSDLYLWTMENVPVAKPDVYPLYSGDFRPMVLVAPFDFEIQDYQGNFNSWEDLSKFYYTLNANRDVLPLPVIAEIKQLVKEAKSDREKVLLVYKWMQGRSRYVSIQLGIGGWQTIDAATVSSKGYGDCKALTNFTLAALRQVGITCYAALIKAGEEAKIKADFPSSQFNHVIACAILSKDTMWLECTSQTNKANFMGTFTGGRPALLVMPEGGKLVYTPGYSPQQNLRTSRTIVDLKEDGTGMVDVRTEYTGLQQEMRQGVLLNYSKEEQKKWLMGNINLPSLDLQRFELVEAADKEPKVIEKLTMDVRNCATKTGTRLFVKTSLLSRPFSLPADTERTTDFYLPPSDYSFVDLDSVSYKIPSNYKLETTLPAFQINSIFGSFESKTTFENNQVLSCRKVVLNGGRYTAAEYTAWIEFLKKVRKADRAQVVFVENKQ
jgi:hypothetical protein